MRSASAKVVGGQGAGRERLGHAGQIVQQHMAVGEEAHQHELEHLALADDRTRQLGDDGVGAGGGLGQARRARGRRHKDSSVATSSSAPAMTASPSRAARNSGDMVDSGRAARRDRAMVWLLVDHMTI